MINSETDIRIFVDENRTHNQFISKVEFKPYEQSPETKQYLNELIAQLNQQKLINNSPDTDDND